MDAHDILTDDLCEGIQAGETKGFHGISVRLVDDATYAHPEGGEG